MTISWFQYAFFKLFALAGFRAKPDNASHPGRDRSAAAGSVREN
jgi:hypothetical protein